MNEYRCYQSLEEDTRSGAAGVKDKYVLLDMGVGNMT